MAKLLKLVLWILLGFSISETSGQFLCRTQLIDLYNQPTGTLHVLVPDTDSHTDCLIELYPHWGYSVVLNILQYRVPPHHLLTVEDSDGYKIALLDNGLFMEKKKSIISEKKMKIRYLVNKRYDSTEATTSTPTIDEIKVLEKNSSSELEANDTILVIMNGTQDIGFFHFVYTQVRNGPCDELEFACQNGKCLAEKYVCSGNDRCGDNSDNKRCGPRPTSSVSKSDSSSQPVPLPLITIICTGVLLIGLIMTAFLIRFITKSNKTKKTDKSATPLESVFSNVPPGQQSPPVQDAAPSPSMCSRVHHFFHQRKEDKGEENLQGLPSERFQVPSMYPSLQPSAPEFTLKRGEENRGFRQERE